LCRHPSNIEEAFKVGVGVTVRMVDGVANAGLSREVDHLWQIDILQTAKRSKNGPSDRSAQNRTRLSPQDIQARLFQRRIIIIREIVQSDNMAPLACNRRTTWKPTKPAAP